VLHVAPEHARRIDHNVDPLELVDGRLDGFLVPDVERREGHARMIGSFRGARPLRVGRTRRQDASPELAQRECGAEADAARTAGNEGRPAGEKPRRVGLRDDAHGAGDRSERRGGIVVPSTAVSD